MRPKWRVWLTLNADALEHVSRHVVARLNAGERKDVIAATIDWPERFAKAPELDPQYNRPEDIARMVALRWTGWWDDLPGHFPAMRFEEEAQEALRLAGGLEALDRRARELLPANSRLAARLADWAYYGAPDDPRALRLTVDVYLARMQEPGMPLQESTVYLVHASKGAGAAGATGSGNQTPSRTPVKTRAIAGSGPGGANHPSHRIVAVRGLYGALRGHWRFRGRFAKDLGTVSGGYRWRPLDGWEICPELRRNCTRRRKGAESFQAVRVERRRDASPSRQSEARFLRLFGPSGEIMHRMPPAGVLN